MFRALQQAASNRLPCSVLFPSSFFTASYSSSSSLLGLSLSFSFLWEILVTVACKSVPFSSSSILILTYTVSLTFSTPSCYYFSLFDFSLKLLVFCMRYRTVCFSVFFLSSSNRYPFLGCFLRLFFFVILPLPFT